jgi:hypothetical protein
LPGFKYDSTFVITVTCITDRYNPYSHDNKQPGIVLIHIISFTTTSNIQQVQALPAVHRLVIMAQSSWLNVTFSIKIPLPSSNLAVSHKDTRDLKYPIPRE